MLERTAAKLEPCALPRSLQSTVRPRRTLHTGFWQHGAAAFDLSSLWSYQDRDASDESTAALSNGAPEQLIASTFLLDFLYPNGTIAFLRRFGTMPTDRPSTAVRQHASSRSFTSSAHSSAAAAASPRVSLDEPRLYEPDSLHELGPQTDTISDSSGGSDVTLARIQKVVSPRAQRPVSATELLRKTTDRTDTDYFDSVWDLWRLLRPNDRSEELRSSVMLYLSRSTRIRDARRVIRLFTDYEDSPLSSSQVTATVAAFIQLGKVDKAFKLFQRSLEDESLQVAGMGHLLQFAMRQSNWKLVCRVCDAWWSKASQETIEAPRNAAPAPFGNLKPLLQVFGLDIRVIELKDHLTAMSTHREESAAGNLSDDVSISHTEPDGLLHRTLTEKAIDALPVPYQRILRTLARLAIQQPCDAKHALTLIRIAGPNWYWRYLKSAAERRDFGAFIEVYKEYRQLPRAQFRPSLHILHSAFSAMVNAKDARGLDLLYEDWIMTHGRLTRSGQERFLTFYASRGDIRAVQNIWETYVHDHEDQQVLKDPTTLNHLLNVHSERGDLVMVRQLFQDMTEQYNVKPDIVSWNILIKTLAHLGLCDEALDTFRQLGKIMKPDSHSFATVMAMCGGRGDIDTAMALLEDAKRLKVPTTIGMISGLVEGCCLNDRFEDARTICIKASREGIPGEPVNLWNCLLRYKARRRDMGGLRRVVALMKSHGIEKNRTSEEIILHGLANNGHTGSAYAHLLKAIEDGTFIVSERLYTTVLLAARRNREWPIVIATHHKMEEAGITLSGQAQLAVAWAMLESSTSRLGGIGEVGKSTGSLGSRVVEYFEYCLAAEKTETLADGNDGDKALRDHAEPLGGQLQKALYVQDATALLTACNDIASARRLLDVFADNVGMSLEDVPSLPLPILESMMRIYLLERKFDQVKAMWNAIFQQHIELGRAPPGSKHPILPVYRHSLSRPFGLLHRALVQSGEVRVAVDVAKDILNSGFTLSSLQWNHICYELALSGDWMGACELCEQILMPGWRGWRAAKVINPNKPNRLSAAQKIAGSAHRFLRPNSRLLVLLTAGYYSRRRGAFFDQETRKDMDRVKKMFPRLMYAFGTAVGHGPEGLVTREGFSMNEARVNEKESRIQAHARELTKESDEGHDGEHVELHVEETAKGNVV